MIHQTKGVLLLNYPEDYLSFLVHFHGTRDYFECHEILEEYWKETAPKERDSHWVGLIQIAVALYHERRGNKQGATRTLTKAIEISILKKAELNNWDSIQKNCSILLQRHT